MRPSSSALHSSRERKETSPSIERPGLYEISVTTAVHARMPDVGTIESSRTALMTDDLPAPVAPQIAMSVLGVV